MYVRQVTRALRGAGAAECVSAGLVHGAEMRDVIALKSSASPRSSIAETKGARPPADRGPGRSRLVMRYGPLVVSFRGSVG